MTSHGNNQVDWGSSSEPSNIEPKYHRINKDNRNVYLSVARMLGTTAILCVIGSIALSYIGKEIPNVIVAIGSIAVGGLGNLFNQTK